MRVAFVVSLCFMLLSLLAATGAQAEFVVKYFIDGHVIAPDWGNGPSTGNQRSGWIAEMDGDPSSPEMIVFGNPPPQIVSGWYAVGIAHIGTGVTEWFTVADAGNYPGVGFNTSLPGSLDFGTFVAPTLYDVDGDDLTDALVPVWLSETGALRAKTVVIGWSGVVGMADQDPGASSLSRASSVSPNPSLGSCRVSFSVPSDGPVSVQVFDVGSRAVRRLLEGQLPAGPCSIIWDGKDNDGHEVPAGVYFTQVTTAQGTTRGRAVLAR